MGRRSITGGVRAKGTDRIEFAFTYQGKRYRPSIHRAPTEANLRRARLQWKEIQQRIRYGTFDFLEEFPDYRYSENLADCQPGPSPPNSDPSPPHNRAEVINSSAPAARTCNEVFDAFLHYCDMRVRGHDLAHSTVNGYRKILNRSWRPKLGERDFQSVKYSELVAIATAQKWQTKKTYNNGVSPLRCAFEFGYKDHPELSNPAEGLDCFRITKKDRPKVDPFTIVEAERLIRGLHIEWGEAIGNYDEFRFFTGLRQSEQIGLTVEDCDLDNETIEIRHVVVLGRAKDRTKTNEDRTVELCPRALAVLKRQLTLRERLVARGTIEHQFVFFKADGEPIRCLKHVYSRWCFVTDQLGIRYREPYNARHSCVSWNLMIGKNLMWCARQHGHSVQVMLSTYGTWIEGAKEADVAAIRIALGAGATAEQLEREAPSNPLKSPEFATNMPPEPGWGRLSWRKVKHFNSLIGGADGTRTRDPRRDRPVMYVQAKPYRFGVFCKSLFLMAYIPGKSKLGRVEPEQ